MAVTEQTPLNSYTANGVTTSFPFAYLLLLATDLTVQVTDTSGTTTTKTLGVDYTVAGLGAAAGGTVNFLAAPANGSKVVIFRDSDIARATDYQDNGDLLADTLNQDFDRLWLVMQEIFNGGKGPPTALRVPNGETVPALPTAASRASRVLAFDSSGNPIAIAGVDSSSAAALALDLANGASATKGAALVAYSAALNYASGTIGARLRNEVFATDAGVNAKGDFNPGTLLGTDDTAALQVGLDLAGSRVSPPTMTFVNQVVNAPQGVFRLAPGKNYKITAALKVPPGVEFDLNGSTLWQRTAGEDCVQLLYQALGYAFYGRFFDRVHNGILQGLGSGISTARGLFLDIVNFGDFRGLTVQGFKYGRVSWEVQYTNFDSVFCIENTIGSYTTARPSDTTLTSIDNNYRNCVDAFNTLYGTWNQCESSSTYTRHESSRNGVCDLLLGAALTGQLRTFTVNSGGSGYPASSVLPVTITDGSGLYAQAFAVTSAGGAVTAVYSVDAGMGYVAPTISVPGGGVLANVTASPVSDAVGDWSGVSATSRGMNLIELKTEHAQTDASGDRPLSGYAVIINGATMRQNRFVNLNVQRQGSGNRQYFRWLFNAGFGNMIDLPGDSSGPASTLVNPAVANDFSIFRSVIFGGIGVRWNTFFDGEKMFRYAVNAAGSAAYDGEAPQFGFDPNTGGLKCLGVTTEYYNTFYSMVSGRVYGDTQDRFQVLLTGDVRMGNGAATPSVVLRLAYLGLSGDRGDSSVTLTAGSDQQVQRFATTLTANRTITLATAGAVNGDKFRVVRTGLGAFTLDVGGLKTMPSATAAWCEVGYDGSVWRLIGYGTL